MELKKQCKTCEFNFDGTCAGDGGTYEYGEEIVDETETCEGWSAGLDYFTDEITYAPRFLREQFNDCSISYDELSRQREHFIEGKSEPINFFDAIKFIYGISMVDIAVLSDVSFGVVYNAKTKGVPQKRINKFAEILCLDADLLNNITTADFPKLQKSREIFFNQEQVELQMTALPEWKQELAYTISNIYLKCPIHVAIVLARVDKFYWTSKMKMEDFTECEKNFISYVTSHKPYKGACEIDYSLDIGGRPHMRVTYLDDSK